MVKRIPLKLSPVTSFRMARVTPTLDDRGPQTADGPTTTSRYARGLASETKQEDGTPADAVCGLVAMLLLGIVLGMPRSAAGQDSTATAPSLIERYQAARLRILVDRLLREGGPGVATLPAERIPTPVDTLLRVASDTGTTTTPEPSGPRITERRVVRKLERAWFDSTYAGTEWAYLGRSRQFTFLDTTQTRDLRARMQAVFGRPTETLGDFDLREPRDAYVQFEYRFVINDTLPVVVTDVSGPNGRGVILSSTTTYRDSLFALRAALLDTLRHAPRAPYVDYYYDVENDTWYRTGYDGTDFFRTPTSVSETTPRRRPALPQSDTTGSSEAPSRSPPPNRQAPVPDR